MVKRMRNVYLQRWALSTVEHYEFDNPGFAGSRGTSTRRPANNIAKHGMERFNGFLADLQVGARPTR